MRGLIEKTNEETKPLLHTRALDGPSADRPRPAGKKAGKLQISDNTNCTYSQKVQDTLLTHSLEKQKWLSAKIHERVVKKILYRLIPTSPEQRYANRTHQGRVGRDPGTSQNARFKEGKLGEKFSQPPLLALKFHASLLGLSSSQLVGEYCEPRACVALCMMRLWDKNRTSMPRAVSSLDQDGRPESWRATIELVV